MSTPIFPPYWIVSVALNKEGQKEEEFRLFSNLTSNLSRNYRFNIPDLKVGTLDSLMQLSDELNKHDLFSESTVMKLAANLSNLLDRDSQKLETNLAVDRQSITEYLERFVWNEAKYPIRSSIKDLTDSIVKNIGEIDAEMKVSMTNFNNVKTSLANFDRKQTGNLLVRSLTDIVSKENFVLGSEYLTTLVVVVPKFSYKEWENSYETLAEFVVPKSSTKISEDKDYILVSVTLFKRSVDNFKSSAREKRFIVRDFEFNEQEINQEKQERVQLGSDLKKQLANLIVWCKTNFSETFEAWIHLKAIRIFVESILRYGLPPNFLSVILVPNMKNEKKLRTVLQKAYGKDNGKEEELTDDAPIAYQTEYYPYVFFGLNTDLIK